MSWKLSRKDSRVILKNKMIGLISYMRICAHSGNYLTVKWSMHFMIMPKQEQFKNKRSNLAINHKNRNLTGEGGNLLLPPPTLLNILQSSTLLLRAFDAPVEEGLDQATA